MSRGSGETADDIVADGEKPLLVFCQHVSGQAGLVIEAQGVYVVTTAEGEVPDTERVPLVFRDIDGHILIGFCLCAGKRRCFIVCMTGQDKAERGVFQRADLFDGAARHLCFFLDQNEKSVN